MMVTAGLSASLRLEDAQGAGQLIEHSAFEMLSTYALFRLPQGLTRRIPARFSPNVIPASPSLFAEVCRHSLLLIKNPFVGVAQRGRPEVLLSDDRPTVVSELVPNDIGSLFLSFHDFRVEHQYISVPVRTCADVEISMVRSGGLPAGIQLDGKDVFRLANRVRSLDREQWLVMIDEK